MPSDHLRLERVRAAEDAARKAVGCHLLTTAGVRLLVREVIDAYDPPPKPKWPTEESRRAANAACIERGLIPFADTADWRAVFRAVLIADPIIKAAIELCNWPAFDESSGRGRALLDAVNEAGL